MSELGRSSAWTAKANKREQSGYGLNYLIHIEHAVIVDVEATPALTYDEVAAARTMIDCTARCFDLKPKRLIADAAYGHPQVLRLAREGRVHHAPHPGMGQEFAARWHVLARALQMG